MAESPLQGLKVLDFTQAMAGPFATMLLGDLGCDVIKVEPLTGDQTRKWAPPYQNGMSSYFLSANRNKRSIAVDLKKPAGIEVMKRLLRESDIVVENFRPGTMNKLELSYGNAKSVNKEVIYCSLSGYGQTGPFKDYPAYDLTLLSYTGLMSITGEKGRPPVKFGVPIADIVSGLFAAISIVSAAYARAGSGRGQYIDMSMFDGNLLTLTHQAFGYFATGKNPGRLGSAHSSIAPYQAFATSDGYVSISVGTEKLWGEFISRLGLSHLKEDPRFTSNVERVRNREALAAIITEATMGYKTSELVAKLMEAGIPCAPINTVGDAVNSDQAMERGMNIKINTPYGEIMSLGTPFKLSENPGKIRRHPPMLGEHTIEILEELGFNHTDSERLSKEGVINSGVVRDQDIP